MISVSIRRISLRQGGEATQVRSQAFSNDSSSGGVTAKIENVPIGKTGRRNPVTNVPNIPAEHCVFCSADDAHTSPTSMTLSSSTVR